MADKDYYAILGVSRTATAADIKQAYRRRAKQYHPDRNPGDPGAEARFKELQAAYAVLKDPTQRDLYDRYGAAGQPRSGHAGEWRTAPGGQRVYTSGGSGIDFEDILRNMGAGMGDFFGGGGRQRPSREPQPPPDIDVRIRATISFEQALHGTTLQVQGTAPDGQRETLSVKVPPGIDDGQTVRVRGKGAADRGGHRGDVLIECAVKPHRYFRRDGSDIHLDVPIDPFEAMLGTHIDVPTLDGQTTVTVPPGTASGTTLRLRAKGIARAGSARGHQFLHITIVPPGPLTAEQREQLEALSATIAAAPREGLWS